MGATGTIMAFWATHVGEDSACRHWQCRITPSWDSRSPTSEYWVSFHINESDDPVWYRPQDHRSTSWRPSRLARMLAHLAFIRPALPQISLLYHPSQNFVSVFWNGPPFPQYLSTYSTSYDHWFPPASVPITYGDITGYFVVSGISTARDLPIILTRLLHMKSFTLFTELRWPDLLKSMTRALIVVFSLLTDLTLHSIRVIPSPVFCCTPQLKGLNLVGQNILCF